MKNTKLPPNPNDPLGRCPCGAWAYHDQTFMSGDDIFLGRVVTYHCTGVVVVLANGRAERRTSCLHPIEPDKAVKVTSTAA